VTAKKVQEYLILAALPGLMLCVVPVEGMDFRLSWHLAFLWLGCFLFTAWLSSWWLRAMCLVSLVAAASVPPVITAYLTLGTIMAGLAVIEKISGMEDERVLSWIQIAACAGLLWMGLQQHAGILPEGRFIGPFNPDAAGVFLALCLPAFFSRKTWPFIGIILAAIILTKTSTGFAAAIAACAVAAFVAPLSRKSKVAALAAIVILAGLFVWKVDPIAKTIGCDRWIAWSHGTRAAIHAPAGYGLGSWETVFPLMASGDARLGQYFRQAHNEYIQYTFEAGWPAVVLMATFIISAALIVVTGAISPPIAGGMAALAVSCAGWHTFHVAPLALIGCAWLGLFLKNAQKGAYNEQGYIIHAAMDKN